LGKGEESKRPALKTVPTRVSRGRSPPNLKPPGKDQSGSTAEREEGVGDPQGGVECAFWLECTGNLGNLCAAEVLLQKSEGTLGGEKGVRREGGPSARGRKERQSGGKLEPRNG